MIGKVARFGSRFLGALQYCYYATRANRSTDFSRVRGELLYAQHLGVSVVADPRLKLTVGATAPAQRLHLEDMADQMQTTAARNDRIRKPVWHQSFSFPPGECPSAEVMIRICQSFSRTFGLDNNPMVVFRHRDREHEHFHIIASRVDLDGQNTALSSLNYRAVSRFCRTMETRHGLTPGAPMALETRRQSAIAAGKVSVGESVSPKCSPDTRAIDTSTQSTELTPVRQRKPGL